MTAREAIDKAHSHFKKNGFNEDELTHAPLLEMALLYMMENLTRIISCQTIKSIDIESFEKLYGHSIVNIINKNKRLKGIISR